MTRPIQLSDVSGTAPAPFVGREEELRILSDALDAALAGRARAVLVSGEAGIGKTRLLRELRAVAFSRGARVCYGRAYENLTLPYLPFVESLLQQFGAVATHADGALADELRTIERFLHGHTREAEAAEAGAALESEHERLRVFLAIVHATIALAQREPLVLVVDDLHWADQASLDLFTHLLFSVMDTAETVSVPFLIVGSHRPVEANHPLFRVLARFSREPICRTIDLAGLGETETDALIEGMGFPRPPQQVLAAITRATAGNPLFIQEVTHQLRRLGLADAAEGYRVQEIGAANLQLPGEVTEAIQARVRDLDPGLLEILTLASVLGERCSLPLLSVVAGRSEDDLLTALEAAIDLRLMVNEGEEFRFAHPLIRHVLYGAPIVPRRRRLHLRVAEALEGRGDADIHALEIAHHLIEAGPVAELSKVALWARRAGDRALAVYAWNDAARYYGAAMAAAEAGGDVSPRDLADLYYHAGLAHYRDLDAQASLTVLDKAVAANEAIDHIDGLAWSLVQRTAAMITLGFTAAGETANLQPLQNVLDRLGTSRPQLRGEILAQMSDAYFVGRQLEQSFAAARQALAIGREIESDAICARATTSLALAQSIVLLLRESAETYRQSSRYAARTGDAILETWPACRLGHVLLQLGHIEEAEAAARYGVALSERSHHWSDYSLALSTEVAALLARGAFPTLERSARRVMQMVRRTGYPWGGVWALLSVARARLLQGATAEAEDAIALWVEPGRLFAQAGPLFEGFAWIFTQMIHAHAGRRDAVRASLAANPALVAADGEADSFNLEPFCAIVEIAERLEDAELADRPYAALREVFERGVVLTGGFLFLVPRILGVAAALNRRWDPAAQHFEQALAAATDGSIRPELGRTCLDYARMLAARGRSGDRQRAADLLRRALALFDELEMRPFADQALDLAVALRLDVAVARRSPSSHWVDLSEREAQILSGLARGRSDEQIADDLLLRPETVTRFVTDLCARTGAVREGLAAYLRTQAGAPVAPAATPEATPGAVPSSPASADGLSVREIEVLRQMVAFQDRYERGAAHALMDGAGDTVDTGTAPPPVSMPAQQPAPGGLTARELEVLKLVAAGHTNKEIAGRLDMAVPTASRHIANIYTKIGARGRADAIAFALRHGLLDG
jgi:DNA-binding CsgD family transcriptional regulator